MLDTALKVNVFLGEYCRKLVADIPDERMAEQPVLNVNHPAWILGHLAIASYRVVTILGGTPDVPTGWMEKFGPGSKPTASRADYPPKDELLRTADQSFEQVRKAIAEATPEQMNAASTNPYTKHALPTVKDGVAFLVTGHLGVHLGQLSMWRRMIGLPHLF